MKRRKKIWFAVINDLTTDQRMHRICSALQDEGYEVTLIGRKLKNSIPLTSKKYHQKRISCFFSRGFLLYLEFNIRLFIKFLFGQTDFHGACDLDTLLALRWAGFLMKRKTVFDAHEYFTEAPEVMNRKFVKSVWSWIGRSQIPRTAARYTVNRPLAEELEKVYKTKFEVVKNVPELKNEIERNGHIKVAENIIIYQGALNVGRGLEASIEMMQYLDNYILWLVGDGDITQKLKNLAKEKQVQSKVVFWGKKNPNELMKLTQKASLGLNLLDRSSKNYYFSLANKFFDYMHTGIPSVNMNFPVYHSIIKEYQVGICVNNLDPKVLAKEIELLLENPFELANKKAACREAAQLFNWENEKLTLLKIWSQV